MAPTEDASVGELVDQLWGIAQGGSPTTTKEEPMETDTKDYPEKLIKAPNTEETRICKNPDCKTPGPQPLSNYYAYERTCKKCRNRQQHDRKKAKKAKGVILVAMKTDLSYGDEGPLYELWKASEFEKHLKQGHFPGGTVVVYATIGEPVLVKETTSYSI
jgi:hypothetical protein